MRPWRDIISADGWDRVIQKTDSTAQLSKVQALKAKFDASIVTPQRALGELAGMIRSYHQIAKTNLSLFPERAIALKRISQAAEQFMLKFKVDQEAAKERQKLVQTPAGFVSQPQTKNAFTGTYMAGNPQHQSLDRNILTLHKRAARKAKYLAKLRLFYASNSPDPHALLAELRKPQERTADATGLTAGVRMEALDPFHRPVEVDFKDGELHDDGGLNDANSASAAFSQWYGSIGRHNLPFFVWLEGHPICTCDDKAEVAGVASVTYLGSEQSHAAAGVRFKLASVASSGGKLLMQEMRPGASARAASTDGYSCNSAKGVSDAAAFVWTGTEILIAQHQESGFHHSSFLAGGLVKCAGMIKFDAGQLTYVSNNSGHYKPSKDHLWNFVRHVYRLGALAPKAVVHCFGLADKPPPFAAADFLRRFI